MIMIGVDVHRQSVTAVAVDEAGRLLGLCPRSAGATPIERAVKSPLRFRWRREAAHRGPGEPSRCRLRESGISLTGERLTPGAWVGWWRGVWSRRLGGPAGASGAVGERSLLPRRRALAARVRGACSRRELERERAEERDEDRVPHEQ